MHQGPNGGRAGIAIVTIEKHTQAMMNNSLEYFEELEIEHDFKSYYATGYVEYTITRCIGSNFEGHSFDQLINRELYQITICELWYFDEDTGNAVEILNLPKYQEIEEIAEEFLRYKYE